MLRDIFDHPSKIRLVPWIDRITTTNMVNVDRITTKELSGLRAPKISYLDSRSMCIFGIRICATDTMFSSGSWLKNAQTQVALERHRVDLTISNSTCDSGQMLVAGTIFLKHPVYTHQLYFLLALRQSLSTNTPYFDIAVHRQTASGPHCPISLSSVESSTKMLCQRSYRTSWTASKPPPSLSERNFSTP